MSRNEQIQKQNQGKYEHEIDIISIGHYND